ncbi:MAG: hypothetical protein HY815_11880 [Candidatus Riflebacteria bacterium]|nr:hypothetical protein [Candidatus Riflebacteria bacterium]
MALAGSPALVLAVLAALTWAARLLGRGPSTQAMALAAVLVGNGPALLLAVAALPAAPDRTVTGTAAVLIYAAVVHNLLGYATFHLVNMSETARRIRILEELRVQRTVSVEELGSRYGSRQMLSSRIDRLVALGQISRQGDRLVSTGRVLAIAAGAVAWWRRILGWRRLARKRSERTGGVLEQYIEDLSRR